MPTRPIVPVLCAAALAFTACKIGGGIQIRGLPSSLTSGGDGDSREQSTSGATAKAAPAASSSGSKSAAAQAEKGPDSKLAALSQEALIEIAVKDTMGTGYGVEVSQPDPTEKPILTPKLALSHDDQLVLLQKVWAPVVHDKENARTLRKAMCAYDLRRSGKKWDKTVGEALDARACHADVSNNDVYRHPEVRLAMARLLLEGHPKKDELLGQVALYAAKAQGGKKRIVCYRTRQTPEPTPAVDTGCTEFWRGTWNGYGNVPSLGTYFVEPILPKQMRVSELREAAYYAKQVPASSSAHAEAEAFLKTIEKLEKPRLKKRKETLAKMRSRRSKHISLQEVEAEFPKSYLWHEVCGVPVDDGRWEGNAFVQSKMLCVKVATEDRDGCEIRDFTFRKYRGAKKWVHYSTAYSAKEIECP